MDAAAFLPEFDREMAATRLALSQVPDTELGMKPHERSWSMAELAGHIANIPVWLTLMLGSDGLDLAQPMDPPELPSSIEGLLGRFDASVSQARTALSASTGEALAATWTLRNGDHVVFAMPRAEVMRGMILNHMIHHRGQLTVYLRLAGARVPGLYGPSADDGP